MPTVRVLNHKIVDTNTLPDEWVPNKPPHNA